MSLPNRSSGAHFLNLSAYNKFRSFISRRSDSSVSDVESIQSSRADEQGSTGDCLLAQLTEGEILSSPNLKTFTFNELKSATSNFRPDSFIGEGGFGYVFKGWIDEQTFTASRPGVGMAVAVKKLKQEGFHGHKEWLTEIRYLGQLHHPSLVKLIGFCSDGDNRLLVYEFMPRGSLHNHLFGRCAESLSWDTRVEVAIGAAKGLALLHDAKSPVIHRDVKSSNILLDSDFNAKLSEFGLARVGPTGDMTHVSTRVMGTMGYAAPEYLATDADTINASFQLIWAFVSTGIFSSTLLMLVVIIIIQHFPIKIETGHLSAKADVYSFGVVLLELLSGRRAYDESNSGTERNLVDWARPYLGNRRKLVIVRLMDSKLEGRFPKMAVQAMAKLVSVCIANDPKLRPRMSEVLAVLEKFQDP